MGGLQAHRDANQTRFLFCRAGVYSSAFFVGTALEFGPAHYYCGNVGQCLWWACQWAAPDVLAQLLFDHVLVMGSRQRTLQMDDAENRTVSIAANACCKCNCHQMCRSHFFACASSSIFQCWLMSPACQILPGIHHHSTWVWPSVGACGDSGLPTYILNFAFFNF